jgi:hypothetical protein
MRTNRAIRLLSSIATLALGCGGDAFTNDPSGGGGAAPTCATPTELGAVERPTQLDVLFAIDNSRSMADKQTILASAVADLLARLVNPECVDGSGSPVAAQPAGPLDACPEGSSREIDPLLDIHIGIVSSSLGGHGSDSCDVEGNGGPTNDDRGHLVARLDASTLESAPTYQDKGFLAWDPAATRTPPGETNFAALSGTLGKMVLGVGQLGCGYESQLESLYRFLVDPAPYETLSVESGVIVKTGVDPVLLAQRANFLRPASRVLVISLSDENDCSTREEGQYYLSNQTRAPNGQLFLLPRARSECGTDPANPCCASCGTETPAGCPDSAADPSCLMGPYTALEDNVSLRCFEQKRRFGMDFLYPTDRYVQALTEATIPDASGQLVPNPLFTSSNSVSPARSPSLVHFVAIVGVPWQDLARDPKTPALGTKVGLEMSAPLASGLTTWDIVLGEPKSYAPAADPLMVESVEPRVGTNPITGDAMAPPGVLVNPINGSEYSIPNRDDLQYSCVFPIEPRDCSVPGIYDCDCDEPQNDNPLCEEDPNTRARTRQVRGKAYPGLRQLDVVRGLGERGIPGSICPVQMVDTEEPTYGYRVTMDEIARQLRFASGAFGFCVDDVFPVNGSGQALCTVIEARQTGGACTCGDGRVPLAEERQCLLTELPGSFDCFCEIPEAAGSGLSACQNDTKAAPIANGALVNGFCAVDASSAPPLGEPKLAAACPSQHLVRFVGSGAPSPDGTVFIACP